MNNDVKVGQCDGRCENGGVCGYIILCASDWAVVAYTDDIWWGCVLSLFVSPVKELSIQLHCVSFTPFPVFLPINGFFPLPYIHGDYFCPSFCFVFCVLTCQLLTILFFCVTLYI